MSRLNLALIAIVAFLFVVILTGPWPRPEPGLTEDEVRAIVVSEIENVDTVKRLESAPEIDAATLDPMIENYLLANPSILEQMSVALTAERRAEEAEQNRIAISAIRDDIYNDPDHAVVGNPDGDVTLVELFDYNCSYCRTAVADMAGLISEDPNLKVVFKEFPILSQGSVDAARVAVAATRAGVDYWDFHMTLFTGRGQVTKEAALDAVEELGLDRDAIAADAESDAVSAILQKSYDIAQILSINGTPAYIIGDEVISGAIGYDSLKQRIDNMRACGKTVCDS